MIVEFLEEGKKFQYTATAAVSYHELVVVNGLVGVASAAAAINEKVVCDAWGVYTMTKEAGDTYNQGAKVYMDGDGKLTPNATRTEGGSTVNNTYIGITWIAAASADTTIAVKIN